jgi:hypothetical protein
MSPRERRVAVCDINNRYLLYSYDTFARKNELNLK